MNIVVSQKAEKFLRFITDAHLAERIENRLKQLVDHPNLPNIQKLQGFRNVYRARVGDYRIVYRVEETVIHIEAIGHRREIYR